MLTAPVIKGSFSLVPELRMWNCKFSDFPVAPSDWQFRKSQILTNQQQSWGLQQAEKHTFILHHICCHIILIKRLDEVIVMMWKKICTRRKTTSWSGLEEGRAGGCGNHEDGSVIACVSAHMAVDVFLVKLMKIEPLKASSVFCSGRRLLKQTKTKPPQSVSFCHLSLLGRQLHRSQYPSKTPQVCVCVFKSPPLEVYISRRGRFTMKWER